MKYFIIVSVLILSACTVMQGVPVGNGHYKYISGGESKEEAFSEIVSIMKNTCKEDRYEVIEQVVEGNGPVFSRVIKSNEKSYSVNDFTFATTEGAEYENFRGYDMTTIFACSKK
jgi:hypothetical protein